MSHSFDNTRQIRAKHLKEGDFIVYEFYHSYVDEVQWTRDNQVMVRTGYGGTGTDWFDPEDLLTIGE